jgi:hypothetical protein
MILVPGLLAVYGAWRAGRTPLKIKRDRLQILPALVPLISLSLCFQAIHF